MCISGTGKLVGCLRILTTASRWTENLHSKWPDMKWLNGHPNWHRNKVNQNRFVCLYHLCEPILQAASLTVLVMYHFPAWDE